MKMNQNGFSLIELLAVLVLMSVALVPLLFSFTNSLRANEEALTGRLASSVGDGAIYAIEKIPFSSYRAALDSAQGGGALYLELNADNCDTAFTDPTEQIVCGNIFAMTSSNLSFDSSTFKIFIFDYSLTATDHTSLYGNVNIPTSAQNEIETNSDILNAISTSPPATQNLIWMVIWIEFYESPQETMVFTGIIANDDPVYWD